MKAIIQAGGLGTRLKPITHEIPKPLLPVKKKPIVNHLIELFDRHGVSEVALLINRVHHSEDFRRWQKAWEGELPAVKVSIFFEDLPRGTFGGTEQLKEWAGDENFFFSNGDELKDFDLTAMKEFHLAEKGVGTIALVKVPNPSQYGVPIMDGNKIKDFLEKPESPPSDFISSGLYMLNPKVFDYADFSQEFIMIEKDVFPKLAALGKLSGFKTEGGRWYDCGTLERWEKAMQEW